MWSGLVEHYEPENLQTWVKVIAPLRAATVQHMLRSPFSFIWGLDYVFKCYTVVPSSEIRLLSVSESWKGKMTSDSDSAPPISLNHSLLVAEDIRSIRVRCHIRIVQNSVHKAYYTLWQAKFNEPYLKNHKMDFFRTSCIRKPIDCRNCALAFLDNPSDFVIFSNFNVNRAIPVEVWNRYLEARL